MKRIAITGAACNLGGLLAQHLKEMEVQLHLLIHHKNVPESLRHRENFALFPIDLARNETLYEALDGVNVVFAWSRNRPLYVQYER
ncbi:MAG: hypothetical protein LUF85_05325 [Bacteroides sp.]|nr:hypothetical protein [Bacteroides sp.]